MWINYLKLAIRSLLRGRLYSVINVTGFAVGIAAALALFLYVRYELTYDHMHPQLDRLYQVQEYTNWLGDETDMQWTPAAMGPALAEGLPDVETVARYRGFGTAPTEAGEKKLLQTYCFADPSFFDLFALPILHRSGPEILTEPNTVAITESVAARFFPDTNPIGQTMVFEDHILLTVEAVIADPPKNTRFNNLECVLSMETCFTDDYEGADERTNWYSHNYYTYVRLRDGVDQAVFENQLEPYLTKTAGEDLRESFDAHLVPFTQLHLGGDYRNVAMIGMIGAFILLIACINYMNLATARSLKRAREIGVRKVLGGTRYELMRQFLSEALLVTGISVLLALLLLELAFPWFEGMISIPLRVALNLNLSQVVLALVGLAAICGLLAGSYPALVLSGFRPVKVLKSGAAVRGSGARMRKFLVVFQFAISLALIFGTITILSQHRYLLQRDLGFDEDGLIFVTLRGEQARLSAYELKQELLKSSRIENVSIQSQVIGRTRGGMWTISTPAMADEEEAVFAVFSDPDYIRTLGLNLVWGRDFDPDRPGEKDEAFLVNEEFVRHFGIDANDDPRVTLNGTGRHGQIIGVLEDYNFQPLQNTNAPAIIAYPRNLWDNRVIAVRVNPGSVEEALAAIEAAWVKYEPQLPLVYHFLDEWLQENYTSEQELANLLSLFAGLAIVVASLGLLGLAAYATETRTKEIGIRKVLGADSGRIILLLTGDFLRPVLLANLIAWPAAWLFMRNWLQDFPYRIEQPWLAYLAAAGTVLLVAWAVMASTTLRAALNKPAKALRYE